MEKIRVAFIGCGGISNGHAERLIAMPDAEIVALCDNNPDQLTRYAERHPSLADVPTFEDWEAMLDAVECDAIEIHTPHTLHYEQIMSGLDRGLHVLAEKPMVCTTEHALAVADKVEETGLKLQVSYQRHFQPEFRYSRELIARGDLGDVHFVTVLQGQNWKLGTKGAWRQVPELSGGGQLNDSGSHLVDIMLWVTGLVPQAVEAFIDNRGTPVDINSAVSMKFTNGAHGTINVVGDSIPWWEDMTIWGEKGVLFFRNGKLTHCSQDGELHLPQHMPRGTDPDRNFIDAILGKAELEVPVECGLRVIQLTEAAWQSAATGKPVEVQHG